MSVSLPVHRGDVWLVELGPSIGVEVRKTCPGIIISNDIANQYSDMVTVIPVSDLGKKTYPFEVVLPVKECGLKKGSKAKCQQLCSVDKVRLVKLLGELPENVLYATERALGLHLGFDPDLHRGGHGISIKF